MVEIIKAFGELDGFEQLMLVVGGLVIVSMLGYYLNIFLNGWPPPQPQCCWEEYDECDADTEDEEQGGKAGY